MKDSRPQFDRRSSGVLMHLTSLPGPHGSGDLGKEAYKFAEFLARAKQKWWQMLPVNPPAEAPAFSPYDSCSAFAGSAWLISLETLAKEGLLSRDDIKPPKFDARKVQFRQVIKFRLSRLRIAFENFAKRGKRPKEYDRFCRENREWLDDYSLFAAIKNDTGGRGWIHWPMPLRLRDPQVIAMWGMLLSSEISFHKFVQFQFAKQWKSLKDHCKKLGVGLLGDLPIFVAYDSADVWANRDLFSLDGSGRPISVSGCPPDVFTVNGQLWGHPQYNWSRHIKTKFAWWTARCACLLRNFDGVRIDHFLGFNRTWCIPYGAKNGRRGKWKDSPGEELFMTIRRKLGRAPIIAEDLGLLVPRAERLRDKLEFPGMRVLQFAWADGDYHRPYNCPKSSVVYTGTHDNQTTLGWFRTTSKRNRQNALDFCGGTSHDMPWSMIRAAMACAANTVITPMQDLLELGDDCRMNIPATVKGNWGWRIKSDELRPALARRLASMTVLSGRT